MYQQGILVLGQGANNEYKDRRCQFSSGLIDFILEFPYGINNMGIRLRGSNQFLSHYLYHT